MNVNPIDPQEAFHRQLNQRLWELVRVQLLGATIGRSAEGRYWSLTLRLPNQNVFTVRAGLRWDQDLTSPATCNDIASRVSGYLREQGLVP